MRIFLTQPPKVELKEIKVIDCSTKLGAGHHPFECFLKSKWRNYLPDFARFEEEFFKLFNWAKQTNQAIKSYRTLVGGPSTYRLHRKFLLADFVLTGGKIATYQHGSFYGMMKFNPFPIGSDFHVSHYFFSWGWTQWKSEYQTIDATPFFSRYLVRGYRGRSRVARKALFISDGFRMVANRLGSMSWIPEQQALKIRRQQSFFRGFPEKLRHNLEYRPYLGERDLVGYIELFENEFEWLRIFRGNLQFAMQDYRLFLMDYPGTTFHFVMARNNPIILLLNEEDAIFDEKTDRVFRKMREVGVVHSCVNELNQFLDENFDQIEDWWFSPKVQEVVKLFKDSYALSGPDWCKHWLGLLSSLDVHVS